MRGTHRQHVTGMAALLVAAASVLLWRHLPAAVVAAEPAAMRVWVQSFGVWAPAVMVAVQVVQVVVVPIPNQVPAAVAGYVFGAGVGTLLTAAGTLTGGVIAFALGRGIGRPVVTAFVPAPTVDRCDAAVAEHGPLALVVLFLFPLFPGDVLCYAAGMSRMRLRVLAAVMVLGRSPKFILYSVVGDRIATAGLGAALPYLAPLILIAAVTVWQRDRLERLLAYIDSWQPAGR